MNKISIITYSCLLAATLFLTGCPGGNASAAELERSALETENGLLVRTVTAPETDFVQYGTYFGELRGVTQTTLNTSAGGAVEAILVQPGDSVQKGQSLGRIKANRAVAIYETAVLAERLGREAYEREQSFLGQGITSQQRVDQAHLEWLQSRTALIEAREVRDGALAISPIDGIVTARHIQMYDDLPPGHATFSVADLSTMRITVGVPEADIAGVRHLSDAEVRFPSFPDRVWHGHPTSFARRRSDRGLTYDVELEIDNTDGLLLAGQTAQVRLALRTYPNAVQIPTRSVVTLGNRSYVFVVNDGTAYQRHIVPGPSNDSASVILQGLTAGEIVVLEGMNRLSNGSSVRIIE